MSRAGVAPPMCVPSTSCSNCVQLVDRQRKRRPERRLADQHGRAAGARRREGLLGHRGDADGLEGVVDTVGDDAANRPDSVLGVGIDRVRRPEPERELPLGRNRIDGDDRVCGDEARAEDRGESDAPAGEHGDGLGRAHIRPPRHGDHAGQDAATEQARQRGIEPGGNRDRGVRRHDCVRGERRDERQMVHAVTVVAEPRRPVGEDTVVHAARRLQAQVDAALQAETAASARGRERQHDVLPHPRGVDAVADRLDRARPLVAEHHRQRCRPLAVRERQVAAADPGRIETHEHLVAARLLELQLLDLELPTRLAEDGGLDLHRATGPVDPRSTSSGGVSITTSCGDAPAICSIRTSTAVEPSSCSGIFTAVNGMSKYAQTGSSS